MIVKEADPNLTEDDILEMLNAGLIEMTIATGSVCGLLG